MCRMSTLEQTRHFLHLLYARCPSSYLTLSAIHPAGQHSAPSRHICLSDSDSLTKGLSDLFCANQQGWGAYFSVATRRADLGRWRRGELADLAQMPAVFVDLDVPVVDALARLSGRDPPPSCVVASGWGVHAYWFLDQPSQNWTLAQAALNTLRKVYQADKTSVVSCLRLPNTHNTKPQRQQALCHILELNAQRYPLDIFVPQLRNKTDQTGQIVPHPKPNLSVPISESTSYRSTPNYSTRCLNVRLVQAVSERLLSQYGGQWKPNGWLAARCPCQHERDGVGMHFSFNPDKGLGVCLGKHGRLLLKDLCSELHIRTSDYGGLYADK